MLSSSPTRRSGSILNLAPWSSPTPMSDESLLLVFRRGAVVAMPRRLVVAKMRRAAGRAALTRVRKDMAADGRRLVGLRRGLSSEGKMR